MEQIRVSVFGVVTIDEIDLHLHPKWQAKAIDAIEMFFPNVQFFITTHSPTVVANFKSGTLYVIQNDEVSRHSSDFFGKQINDVLKNILGAPDRHVPTQIKLNTLFNLIEQDDEIAYQPLLDELTKLLGADDFDITKANSLIEWNGFKNEA